MADNGSSNECPPGSVGSSSKTSGADQVDQPSAQLYNEMKNSIISRSRVRRKTLKCLDAKCKRAFSNRRKLRAHASSIHNLTDLQCVRCRRLYSRDDNLKAHRKTCTGEPRRTKWTYKQSSPLRKTTQTKDQRFDQRVNCQERQSKIQTLQVI